MQTGPLPVSKARRWLDASTTIQVLLFLTLWFAYGLTINSVNLDAFRLQHAGVEAYVERHHFYLEGSQVEQLKIKPVVDAFSYNGHIYPAKQPGQFMAGAVVYGPLNLLGLTYANNYLLTTALVTFLTSSLLTALAAIAVFRTTVILQDSNELLWPLTNALTYGLATTAFPYAGIAWHDSIATGYLVVAFYLMLEIRSRPLSKQRSEAFTVIVGLLLGLTLLTSLLPFFMVIALGLYFVVIRRDKLLLFFAIGAIAGLTPLIIYNVMCYGNPFLMANVAGSYADTFFKLDVQNALHQLTFYLRTLTIYTPVFWFGLFGVALFPRRLRQEQILILFMLLALLVYLLNIESRGGCQYGPRYLLPAMPFVCVGLLGFGYLRTTRSRWATLIVVITSAAISFGINLLGALQGSMLCEWEGLAVSLNWSRMLNGNVPSYPLAVWLIVPFVITSGLLVREIIRRRVVLNESL